MSDSVRPHRRQPTRLPCPWDSPGKNTRVGCHFLLQCMKVKSESKVTQSCPTLSDPMDCSLPGSSVHGIFQAKVLEWDGTAFSNISTRTYKIKRLTNPQKARYKSTFYIIPFIWNLRKHKLIYGDRNCLGAAGRLWLEMRISLRNANVSPSLGWQLHGNVELPKFPKLSN